MKRSLIFILTILHLGYGFSLSIDQPTLHVKTERHSEKSYSLRVSNPNDAAVKVKVYAQDWEYNQSGAKRFLPAGSLKNSCANWIKIEQPIMTIQPKSKQEVWLKIKTPGEAIGGHQAVVFFEVDIPESEKQQLGYGMRLGTIIYQRTKENTKTGVALLKKEIVRNGENAAAILEVQNTGNAWTSVSGELTVVGQDLVKSRNSFGPYNLMPDQIVRITKTLEVKKDSQVLFTLEDYDQNLTAGTLIDRESNVLPEARPEPATENIGQFIPEVTIQAFSVVYNKETQKLKIYLNCETTVPLKIEPQVKIFNGTSGKLLKTVNIASKNLTPDELTRLSAIWDTSGSLTKGEYSCVLSFEANGKIMTAKTGITIN